MTGIADNQYSRRVRREGREERGGERGEESGSGRDWEDARIPLMISLLSERDACASPLLLPHLPPQIRPLNPSPHDVPVPCTSGRVRRLRGESGPVALSEMMGSQYVMYMQLASGYVPIKVTRPRRLDVLRLLLLAWDDKLQLYPVRDEAGGGG
eukprot:127937-Hanusia_phi.AAC.7